jgi:folate-binding protein YgfZ
VHRHDRDLVDVRGPDAHTFLQSLVSQDLDPVAPGSGVPALLLQPQGKLIAPFRTLVLAPDHFVLDTDQGAGRVLLDGLARFKIRVKVDLSLLDDVATLSLRGPQVDAVAAAAGIAVPGPSNDAHATGTGDVRTVRAPWGGTPGIDVFAPTAIADAITARLVEAGAEHVTDDAFETARIEHGVVVFGRDIDESTIAQEAELELDAVSFTKGCFVGQELVCRIDTRGHVNRFVRRLEFADSSPAPAAGTDVLLDGKSIGTITSAAPEAPVALATVRREAESGTTVTVAGRPAVVHSRLST